MTYATADGKTIDQLATELREVFTAYPEYSDPEYGSGVFLVMVEKFANDDFYNLHFVAKRYLELLYV